MPYDLLSGEGHVERQARRKVAHQAEESRGLLGAEANDRARRHCGWPRIAIIERPGSPILAGERQVAGRVVADRTHGSVLARDPVDDDLYDIRRDQLRCDVATIGARVPQRLVGSPRCSREPQQRRQQCCSHPRSKGAYGRRSRGGVRDRLRLIYLTDRTHKTMPSS